MSGSGGVSLSPGTAAVTVNDSEGQSLLPKPDGAEANWQAIVSMPNEADQQRDGCRIKQSCCSQHFG